MINHDYSHPIYILFWFRLIYVCVLCIFIIYILFWHSMEAVAFFTPRPRPYFPCLLYGLVSSHLLRDSLCTALQTERLWIWSTGLSTQLTPSSRWEAWRYLHIRNHDNRSSADWIRLCPGLSKNSENGNSCPKPHKAARHVWSSGKSGQHWDWDY